LRSSKLLLAVLSPHFFDRPYCRKEWETFIEHEQARAMLGEGIAPLYTISVPGFGDETQRILDGWLANMHRRQYVDVRPWREEGPKALQREEVRRRMEALDQGLTGQLRQGGAGGGR